MKCPKCGYLGFETTDKCRNCGYDFSLSPFHDTPELALQTPERSPEGAADFELSSMMPQANALGSGTLDLDRLFGADDGAASPRAEPGRVGTPTPEPSMAMMLAAEVPADKTVHLLEAPESPQAPQAPKAPEAPDSEGLPFDDSGPLAPPARPPLAVRRTTDFPRGRSRTPRVTRAEPALALGLESPAAPPPEPVVPMPALSDPPTLGERLAADAIDIGLLVSIHAAVLALTLRIAGLDWSMVDLRIIPLVPFAGFVAVMSVGYLAMFTVAGGQTIGKMIMRVRVIGDDGRSVDLAGGLLRALGCLLVPLTLGLTYVPVLVTADRRAVHDRLAGTRVVRE